jgi:DNA-binding transcriptional ArsR family regulator
MLGVMLGGGAYTASELAARANIAPSTASEHLKKLTELGLVARASQGRYRFFRLASPEVARNIEALHALEPHIPSEPRTASDIPQDIRFARSCYDHLAGWLGVTVTQAFLDQQLMRCVDNGFEVTPRGLDWLGDHDVGLLRIPGSRRRFARTCLDWTEKRPHLAGVMGAALLSRFISLGWLERWPGERTLALTAAGKAGLKLALGLSLTKSRAIPSDEDRPRGRSRTPVHRHVF